MTWANYGNTGPFTNNTTPPGISATFLNNVESFLDQFAGSLVTDNSISSNGSGVLTAVTLKGVLKSIGGAHTLADWNFGAVSVTSSVVVTHGIKNAAGTNTAPTVVMLTPDTASVGITATGGSVTSTQFTIFVSSSCTVWWLALLA